MVAGIDFGSVGHKTVILLRNQKVDTDLNTLKHRAVGRHIARTDFVRVYRDGRCALTVLSLGFDRNFHKAYLVTSY